MANIKSNPRAMKAAERREIALNMRKNGDTFQAIADELGISKPSAFKTVQVGLLKQVERYSETAEQIIVQELERLDLMLNKMMDRLDNDFDGQFQAVEKILKIMERRAKLLGLDKPTKVAPTDPGGQNPYDNITDTERARRIMEIINEAQGGGIGSIIDCKSKTIKY